MTQIKGILINGMKTINHGRIYKIDNTDELMEVIDEDEDICGVSYYIWDNKLAVKVVVSIYKYKDKDDIMHNIKYIKGIGGIQPYRISTKIPKKYSTIYTMLYNQFYSLFINKIDTQ